MWNHTEKEYRKNNLINMSNIKDNLLEIVPFEKQGETLAKYVGKTDSTLSFVRTTYADEYTFMGVQ